MEQKFKIGDRVKRDDRLGTVVSIDIRNEYPVTVAFDGESTNLTFSQDGRWIDCQAISLFLVKDEPEDKQDVYFEVGDTVYSVDFGEGVVVVINEDSDDDYPVEVKFNDDYHCYDTDGRYHKDGNVSLFQQPIVVPENKAKMVGILSKGDLVLVRRVDTDVWQLGFFIEYKDGKIVASIDPGFELKYYWNQWQKYTTK